MVLIFLSISKFDVLTVKSPLFIIDTPYSPNLYTIPSVTMDAYTAITPSPLYIIVHMVEILALHRNLWRESLMDLIT